MAPLIVLVAVTSLARLIGLMGVTYVDTWPEATAMGLAAMFVLTASAHFVQPRRGGLVAIVPPQLPRPGLVVTVTGYLEAVGAVGLLIPSGVVPYLRIAAVVCLGVLLLAMFPANVYAARAIRGPHAPTTPLWLRTAMQLIFVGACVVVTLGS
ncbi:MAG: DoxX family protein [Galactobacter sp.]|uniref:DoxX family protein n=1 Tax=Galactobacter sp. TaxID=2676125 RepID=UPI0025B9C67D|nr:hypothetical protein [Galactobacter sp.]